MDLCFRDLRALAAEMEGVRSLQIPLSRYLYKSPERLARKPSTSRSVVAGIRRFMKHVMKWRLSSILGTCGVETATSECLLQMCSPTSARVAFAASNVVTVDNMWMVTGSVNMSAAACQCSLAPPCTQHLRLDLLFRAVQMSLSSGGRLMDHSH